MRPRVEWVRDLWWAVPLTILGLVVAALVVNSLVPYRPFVLYEYRVQPSTICSGEDVIAHVTREYIDDFSSLELEETWVTHAVSGLGQGRPVQSSEGVLPPEVLTPQGKQTVQSPLLTEAPAQPGIYRIKITAEAHGWRFNLLPSVGESTYYSNPVTVMSCDGDEANEVGGR